MARRTALSRNRIISEINMTPLIDLTFLLLITFIITFPLIEQGIPVRLPKGKASDLDQANTFSVSLNDKSELFFDDVPTSEEALAAELKAKAEQKAKIEDKPRDEIEDSRYVEGFKRTTTLAPVWALIFFAAVLVFIYFVTQASK